MNGKKAKGLRKAAEKIVLNVLDTHMGDGYNVYNQAMNCVGMAPAKNKETGEIMLDTDGTPLITVVTDLPGTVTTAWKLRIIYQNLKGKYYANKRKHLAGEFSNLSRRERQSFVEAIRLRELKARQDSAGKGQDVAVDGDRPASS